MLLLLFNPGTITPTGPTHTGKSAAFALSGIVGLTPSLSLTFTGRSIGQAGYDDILAVDASNSLNVSTGFDLQVDAVPGDQIVFVGKSSAIVV